MKAAIYCRISRDRTGEEAGVTRQLEDCRNLASNMGWPVLVEYIDNDISATSGKTRPEYERLLAAIKAREIDAVVVWHPDRLYRKLTDLERLIEVVEGSNVIVKPVQAGEVDLSTASGRGIARILGVVATMEGEQKSERWRRSIRQRREAGQAPGWGRRLFGYERDGTVNEPEAEMIRMVAISLIEGQSIRSVTRKLNEAGATSTLGNPFSTQGLKALMQNARLAGHSTLNGDTVGVGQWEAILTDEQFEQVQATFAINRGKAAPRARVSLLLGLVKCSECGTNLISGRRGKTAPDEVGRRVYRCPIPPKADGCGRVAMDAENLEELVEGYAKRRLEDPAVLARIAELSEATGDNTAEIIGLEQHLRDLEAQLSEPGVPVSIVIRALDRTRERIESLRAQVALRPQYTPSREWPDDLGRRARLVRLVVKSVTVSPAIVRGRKFEPDRVEIEPR